jgi:hypothetical protein
MDWIILVKPIGGVLIMPKLIQCKYNTPIRVLEILNLEGKQYLHEGIL